MIRGMAFFHGDKNSAASGTNFPTSGECPFNGRAIVRQIDNSRGKKHGAIRRCGPYQFDCVLCRDSARRLTLVRAFHQMISRGPITMAIEQRADHPAIQNSLKRFVFFLRFPFRDDFAVSWKTPNV
jgi:hypothetical protein